MEGEQIEDEATPRGIIRGMLATGGIAESVKLRRGQTRTPAYTKETPTNPPSGKEVATRLLTRSSQSTKKRKATEVSTPSDSTTPRTLISGFLQTAPVAKSVVKGKRPRKSEPRKSRTTRSISQSEDNTPRTIIQNFLREALAESPELPEVSTSSGIMDNDVPQQTDEESLVPPVTSIHADDAETVTDEPSVTMTTSQQTDQVTLTEEATLRLLDSLFEEDDETAVMVTAQQTDQATLTEEATLRHVDSLFEEDEETVENTNSQQMQEELDGLPSAEATDQTLSTDTVIRGNQTSRQWRDLVTPQLPLDVSSQDKEQLSRSQNIAERSVGDRPMFGGKPPAGKARTNSTATKKPSGPRMPSALVKSIFQHFSKAKVSKEALQVVENGSNLFFKQVSSDLMAYCQHAHRTTIELADVELLMKRQGFITDNQSLYSLVEKFLPLEYRQEIIPTVQAGNNIVLK